MATVHAIDEREQLVKFFEDLRVRAAKGDFQAVSFAGIGQNGMVHTGWKGTARGNIWQLVGAVSLLHHEMVDRHQRDE